MKTVWLAASILGYELLQEGLSIQDPEVEITDLITLHPASKTIMYDYVDPERWTNLGIPVHQIDRIEEEGKEVIKSLNPDLVVMSGWRQIVPKEVLDIPNKGFIGTHPSLLPYGRGPAPIINQIMNGTKKSGITLLYTSEGTDEGDIIAQGEYLIKDTDHAWDVYLNSIEKGRALIREQLPLIAKGLEQRIPQDPSEATVFESPKKLNRIVPQDNLETVYRKIKAVSRPYKGAYLKDEQGNKLTIWRAELTNQKPDGVKYTPGLSLEELTSGQTKLYFESGQMYVRITEGVLE